MKGFFFLILTMASITLSFLIMVLSVVSINCNGLRNITKLQNVFTNFNIHKYAIICLPCTGHDDYRTKPNCATRQYSRTGDD